MANFHVLSGPGETLAHPRIRKIGIADIRAALAEGVTDFMRRPTHYAFLSLIYPIVGLLLALWTSGANALPLLYPLMSGFALLGALAAIGLYEISRREELGQEPTWRDAFAVFHSPALPSIIAVGLLLFGIFYAWLATAETLYQELFGLSVPTSITGFIADVFGTAHGRTLLIAGNLLGLAFAFATLCTTVIAFPLLVDRDVGAAVAIETSIRAVMQNLVPMLAWGIIVAVLLLIGSIPLLVGLAIVVPVLGHATWHLYRRVVDVEGLGTHY